MKCKIERKKGRNQKKEGHGRKDGKGCRKEIRESKIEGKVKHKTGSNEKNEMYVGRYGSKRRKKGRKEREGTESKRKEWKRCRK